MYIRERGEGDGESVVSETLSLLSYTLRYVRLADLGRHGESAGSEALSLLSNTRDLSTVYSQHGA